MRTRRTPSAKARRKRDVGAGGDELGAGDAVEGCCPKAAAGSAKRTSRGACHVEFISLLLAAGTIDRALRVDSRQVVPRCQRAVSVRDRSSVAETALLTRPRCHRLTAPVAKRAAMLRFAPGIDHRAAMSSAAASASSEASNDIVVRRGAIALLALFALVYLLPLGVRPLSSPDEVRYGEIAREMIASGDWVSPHFNGVRYFRSRCSVTGSMQSRSQRSARAASP